MPKQRYKTEITVASSGAVGISMLKRERVEKGSSPRWGCMRNEVVRQKEAEKQWKSQNEIAFVQKEKDTVTATSDDSGRTDAWTVTVQQLDD